MGQQKVISRTMGAGTQTWVNDQTLNDSDKTFTVPANKQWKIRSIDSMLTATATVGNRLLGAYITTSADVIISAARCASCAATQTARTRIVPGQTFSTTALQQLGAVGGTNVSCTDGMANSVVLVAGMKIRVYDTAAIDAAADDLQVVLHYEELDV